jgi:hypothetical protein
MNMDSFRLIADNSSPGLTRLVVIGFILALLSFGNSTPVSAAEDSQVIFCLDLKDWTPLEPAEEFDTNKISAMFKSASSFAAMRVSLSIYRLEEGGVENLIHREDFDINPEWNVWFAQNIPLPQTGQYEFVLNRPDGAQLAKGVVLIKEKKTEEPMPEKIDSSGSTLEAVFNKYSGQARK